MNRRSRIEWTEATWNPVTGCTQVSPGCDHCYAKSFAERFRGVPGHPYEVGFDVTLRYARLDLPLRWRDPRVIFVNSMSDLFHQSVPNEFVERVFATMEAASWHTFQVLTKRPQRAARLAAKLPWPSNVWLGTSVESAAYLWRVDHLRQVPEAIRFLSCEPLLGPLCGLDLRGVGWVIAGGESGIGFRPPDVDWVRHIRDVCAAEGVPFFFKQRGGRYPKQGGRELDGELWGQMPTHQAETVGPRSYSSANSGSCPMRFRRSQPGRFHRRPRRMPRTRSWPPRFSPPGLATRRWSLPPHPVLARRGWSCTWQSSSIGARVWWSR
jgi:protein gp37